MPPLAILKRDGSTSPWDERRIVEAIRRAQDAVGQEDDGLARELTRVTVDHLDRQGHGDVPDVETVQDAVVYVLRESGNYDVALAYTRYRDARERQRRQRRGRGEDGQRPNLQVVDHYGRFDRWDGTRLERNLIGVLGLSPKAARDVRLTVEDDLAGSDVNEIGSHLVTSLVDSALIRCGFPDRANEHAPLPIGRGGTAEILGESRNGAEALERSGAQVLRSWSIVEHLPLEVRRLFGRCRLWVDGLDDPRRGSHFTATLDGHEDPLQIIVEAFRLSCEARRSWRRITLILPPVVLGSLESEPGAYIPNLEELAEQAEVFLYCDGRTPLLDDWPFKTHSISLATYAQDFLILRRLQELGLPDLSGPHLMQGGYRRRVAVSLAINAQGLEEQFSQLDHLAMGLIAAAKARLELLNRDHNLLGADIRFAIFGLSPGSSSNQYLERQVVQEGLRNGIALSRTSSLPEEACRHLGRLFG